MSKEIIVPIELFRVAASMAIQVTLKRRRGARFAQVPWELIEELRNTLTDMGVDWKSAWYETRRELVGPNNE